MSLQGQKTTTTSMDWEQFKSLIAKLERDGENKYCKTIFYFTCIQIKHNSWFIYVQN
jgi:hypothetical protein